MEATMQQAVEEAVAESFRRTGRTMAFSQDTVWQVVSGLRAQFAWLDILKYLPEIISLVQTMGPKIQEIIAIISSFLDKLNPKPPTPFPAP
jgi:hypothetical protein